MVTPVLGRTWIRGSSSACMVHYSPSGIRCQCTRGGGLRGEGGGGRVLPQMARQASSACRMHIKALKVTDVSALWGRRWVGLGGGGGGAKGWKGALQGMASLGSEDHHLPAGWITSRVTVRYRGCTTHCMFCTRNVITDHEAYSTDLSHH